MKRSGMGEGELGAERNEEGEQRDELLWEIKPKIKRDKCKTHTFVSFFDPPSFKMYKVVYSRLCRPSIPVSTFISEMPNGEVETK